MNVVWQSRVALMESFSNALYPARSAYERGVRGECCLEGGPGGHRRNWRRRSGFNHAVSETHDIAQILVAEFVTPMALFLCSEDCHISHSMFSAVAGVYALFLHSPTQGWVPRMKDPPPYEDIAEAHGTNPTA